MRMLRALGLLALPVECVGCALPDVPLCRGCRSRFGEPRRCPQTGLDAWAVSGYSGPARSAILAWKRGLRPDLAAPLTTMMRTTAAGLAPALTEGSAPPEPVLVVPAPSGIERRLARRFVVGELADAVAAGLAATGHAAAAVDVLRRRGGRDHGLAADQRWVDRARSIRLVGPGLQGRHCVLVDDVVTTGATLLACRDVLARAGARVLGALTLAATPAAGTDDLRTGPQVG